MYVAVLRFLDGVSNEVYNIVLGTFLLSLTSKKYILVPDPDSLSLRNKHQQQWKQQCREGMSDLQSRFLGQCVEFGIQFF